MHWLAVNPCPEPCALPSQGAVRAWPVQGTDRSTTCPCDVTTTPAPRRAPTPEFQVCISPPTAAHPGTGSGSAWAWHRADLQHTASLVSGEELGVCCSPAHRSGLSASADGLCQSCPSAASQELHKGEHLCFQRSHQMDVPANPSPGETQTPW